ncbi:MAG: hypothetical protein K1Y36_25540 [Blastocatellia bacterium]|nr:hypothetical protein [Blastocatellia bacterium]
MKFHWIFLTVLAVALGVTACTAQTTKAARGQVVFQPDQIIANNANPEDTAALVAVVTNSWEHYLRLDVAGYTGFLAADVTRMSKRSPQLQQGVEGVAAALPKEWEAFERPGGVIAENMTIKQVELTVDKNPEAMVATVLYWVSVTGGARWSYTDQGLVFQSLAKINGTWKITHQIESWSLGYKLGAQKPGPETFEFDYVYPVSNLERAVKFYQPLLGEPESVTADRATFNLKGPRFILSTDDVNGLAGIERGLPNGYAIFFTKDVVAERNRLKNLGTTFLDGTATGVKSLGADTYVIGQDPAGNIFILLQRRFTGAPNAAAPQITGFTGNQPAIVNAAKVAQAWLSTDTATLGGWLGPNTRWLDDTRTLVRGMEVGKTAIVQALPTIYWAKYDRSAKGLQANLEVSDLRVRTIGSRTIVSYVQKLTGIGAHPYQEQAFVTQVFEGVSTLAHMFIVGTSSRQAPVLELDYTGYPETDLAEGENFYTKVMKLGDPYTDSQWYGYWSNQAVFGIYKAKPERDSLPRPKRANGYVSFWVRSAQSTFDYLKRQGSVFPIVPAINSVSGLDAEPGYVQVYATDSEGNGLIFTEYTGKRR